jgi:hypothetical protein
VSKKRIAAQLGLDIKTVRRYLKLATASGVGLERDLDQATAAVVEALQAAPGRARGADWELCAKQREVIASYLRHGVRLTKVRRLLRRRGVEVPYMTLYRYAVSELEFGRRSATIPVADCGPGEEVQLDTGWVGWLKVDLFGRRKKFRAWILTAVRSRHHFVYAVERETTASAIEACEARRMRQVFALLGLVRRYGAQRLEAACQTALEADMTNVHRLRRLVEVAPPLSPSSPAARVIPIAREETGLWLTNGTPGRRARGSGAGRPRSSRSTRSVPKDATATSRWTGSIPSRSTSGAGR